MDTETKTLTRRVTDITNIKQGDTLVFSDSYTIETWTDMYWAEVTKRTPKTITLKVDVTDHKRREQVWQMRKDYTGHDRLEGPSSVGGGLWFATTDEEANIVADSYTKRANALVAAKAKREAEEQARREYAAQQAAQAHAENPGVSFTRIGMLGKAQLFGANTINQSGRACFVIVSAMHMLDPMSYGEEQKVLWVAKVSSQEDKGQQYGPDSFSGYSGDLKGDTLEQVFAQAIEKVWMF